MISAVVPPQFQPMPSAPPPGPQTVRERAAAGYFRDLALWLNQPLAPHGIFVQVQGDRPGCLRLVVEFQQPPIRDHLLRFLCHRVWRLNSELIEGIHVIARPLGHQRVLWQQRIKIVTPALKQRRQVQPVLAPSSPRVAARPGTGSPMPPTLRSQRAAPRGLSRQRLQTLRAFVLSGSAVAAFVMGCLLELILSGPSPTLPQFSAQENSPPAVEALVETPPAVALRHDGSTAVASQPPGRSGDSGGKRPTVVDAALEPVGVIDHQKPTPTSSDDVTLLFGGDVSLEDIAPEALTAPGGFFADVAEYGEADLSLVNLATPLATAATNLQEELRQQTRADAVDLLVNSGVDIVNLTHSRLMDYGAEGLSETLTTLDSQGLYRIGAGRNALEARRPEVLDVKGKRIAYLSYAMGGNNAAHDTAVLRERAGTDNSAIAQEVERFKTATAFKDRAGFNAQGMPEIVADIQALRPEVDWIVVNFRWVDHLSEQPNFMQTNLARLAIDQGADVVVGYHPTVIQGGEVYKGRPIAYSLGDFVFRPDEPLENQDSAVLKVGLKDDQMKVEMVPVRVRDSRPKTLTGAEGTAVLQRIEQASSQFDKPLTSPVVLDLKVLEGPTEAIGDPDSPFVSPEADQVLPVQLTPPEAGAEPAEDAGESAPDPKGDRPSPLDVSPNSTDGPDPIGSPDGDSTLPDLDLDFDDSLDEWGPKVSPQQREFQPVPSERSGAEAPGNSAGDRPNTEAPAPSPRASGKPVAHHLPSAQTAAWADTVPAVPTVSPALDLESNSAADQ